MSEDLSFGLADLDVQDDLDISMDNETYQDQANPAPPVAGNYGLKAVKLGPKTKKTDGGSPEPIFENNDKRFPILQLTTAEIVEGLGEGVTRKVTLFQDIRTKPFDRYGKAVSNLGDITRSFGTDSWVGIPNGILALEQAAQLGNVFAGQLDWSVYDTQLVTEGLKQLSIPANKDERTEDQKKILNSLYNAARVTGMRFFPYNTNTEKFSHVLVRQNVTFKGPNGNLTVEVPHRALEARATITRYFPKVDVEGGRVKFGPINTKPQQLKNVIG